MAGTDWNEFYGSILGNGIESINQQSRALTLDPIGSGASFSGVTDFLNAGKRGQRNVALPNGDTIAGSGSASKDFMRGIFGVSPFDDTAKTPEGDSVAPGAGFSGGGFDLGPLIGRAAIIITGFIFVAAGLAMFGGNALVKSVAGGVAKGAAIP